jgi:hypothetical protein
LWAVAAVSFERRKDAGRETAGKAAVVFGIDKAFGFEPRNDRGLRGGVDLARNALMPK